MGEVRVSLNWMLSRVRDLLAAMKFSGLGVDTRLIPPDVTGYECCSLQGKNWYKLNPHERGNVYSVFSKSSSNIQNISQIKPIKWIRKIKKNRATEICYFWVLRLYYLNYMWARKKSHISKGENDKKTFFLNEKSFLIRYSIEN